MSLTDSIIDAAQNVLPPSTLNTVPMPNRVAYSAGYFQLYADTVISAPCEAATVARALAERLSPATGFRCSVQEQADATKSHIELRLDESAAALGAEGYRLVATRDSVTIVAAKDAGLFYGVQTLLQLFPPSIFASTLQTGVQWRIPCVRIDDSPRFAWRGAMLDVARHFMPASFLLKFIDALALHKINVLHLHLTDDQGWRIEIKKYPKLTEVGATRKHTMVGIARKNPAHPEFDPSSLDYDGETHEGFYTQDEMRAVVAYAAERHVTVVPEIEMPGHAQSAVAAYPELGCTDAQLEASPHWGIHDVLYNPSEATIEFLQDVLTEVMDIFPSHHIHVGGDEAIKNQWRASAACQARMAELGLTDEAQMQSYLIRRIDTFLTAHGRRLVGWDEILEGGLAPGAIVMSWRGEEGGVAAAGEGHDVIMAPHKYTYLDYYQSSERSSEPLAFPSMLTLRDIYGYEPVPKDLPRAQHHHVLGAQGQLWTEYMPDSSQVEYQAFPRLCALSEVTWSRRDSVDYDGFLARLETHLRRLAAMGINYRRLRAADYGKVADKPLTLVG